MWECITCKHIEEPAEKRILERMKTTEQASLKAEDQHAVIWLCL